MSHVFRCLALGIAFSAMIVWAKSATANCAKGMKVAIDIGHTRDRPGAISARGRKEFDFNRRFVAELIQAAVKSGLRGVYRLHDGDTGLSLKRRIELAESTQAEIFVSIHHDSTNPRYYRKWRFEGKDRLYSDAFRGFSLFVYDKQPSFERSYRLAKAMGFRLKEAGFMQTFHHAEPIPGEGRRLIDWDLGVYSAPFYVLRHSTIPSVLVEVGVLVHRQEEQDLDDPHYRARFIASLLQALRDYCTDPSPIITPRTE